MTAPSVGFTDTAVCVAWPDGPTHVHTAGGETFEVVPVAAEAPVLALVQS